MGNIAYVVLAIEGMSRVQLHGREKSLSLWNVTTCVQFERKFLSSSLSLSLYQIPAPFRILKTRWSGWSTTSSRHRSDSPGKRRTSCHARTVWLWSRIYVCMYVLHTRALTPARETRRLRDQRRRHVGAILPPETSGIDGTPRAYPVGMENVPPSVKSFQTLGAAAPLSRTTPSALFFLFFFF